MRFAHQSLRAADLLLIRCAFAAHLLLEYSKNILDSAIALHPTAKLQAQYGRYRFGY